MNYTNILLLLLLALPTGAPAEIYKWTDAQGRVHFGDRPTEKQRQQAESVQVRDYKPGTDKEVLDVYQRTDRIYDAKERQRAAESEQQDDARKQKERKQQELKDRCYSARERLHKLSGPVVFVDEYGNPVKKTDKEREQEYQELNKWVTANCP